jgi:hypothetical protein
MTTMTDRRESQDMEIKTGQKRKGSQNWKVKTGQPHRTADHDSQNMTTRTGGRVEKNMPIVIFFFSFIRLFSLKIDNTESGFPVTTLYTNNGSREDDHNAHARHLRAIRMLLYRDVQFTHRKTGALKLLSNLVCRQLTHLFVRFLYPASMK